MLLLEQFPELTRFPFNAEKVMDLVLQLAVRGNLTEKWREKHLEAEPAHVLLDKIEREKERLINDKRIKKGKSLPPITHRKLYSLPKKWVWAKLGSLGYCQTGTTPSSKHPEYYGDKIPFLGPGDISLNGDYKISKSLSETGLEVGRLIPKHSVMMVCIGGSIGKSCINNEDVSCNQQINTATPLIIPVGYLSIALREKSFQSRILEMSTGSATPIINLSKWISIEIPLPPLKEQKEIVRIVDHLKQEIDELNRLSKVRLEKKNQFVISSLHNLTESADPQHWRLLHNNFVDTIDELNNVKKLREAILQLAVQGKLSHKWREANPNSHEPFVSRRNQMERSELHASIKRVRKKPKWSKPITEDDYHFDLPDKWKWLQLGDLCDLKNGYAFKSEYFKSKVAQYILTTPGNFFEEGGFRDRPEKRKYYDGPVANEFILNPGDLIIPMTEQAAGLLGSPAFIPQDGLIYLHNQRLAKMTFDPTQVLPSFAFLFFNSVYFRSELARTCTGMKVRHTSPDRILQVPFPLCSVSEQREIVDQANSLLDLCRKLESLIRNRDETAEKLMKAVLAEVLAGS